jgi:hypothetical protein
LYREAFRNVSGIGVAVRDLARVSDELAKLLGASVAGGTLMPGKTGLTGDNS